MVDRVSLPKVLVFDLDDTLIFETEYVQSALAAVDQHLQANYRIQGFLAAAQLRFEQGQRTQLFDAVLTQLHRAPDPRLIHELLMVYRHHRPQIHLLSDVHACLTESRALCSLALITDGYQATQRAKIDVLALDKFFETIIVTDELAAHGSAWKPDPRAFEMIMDRFKVEGSQCCYVGDNPKKDFVGARQLGWKTVRIRRAQGLHYTREASEGYQADLEITTLQPLIPRLRQLYASTQPVQEPRRSPCPHASPSPSA